jgi:hypothetical protein
MNKLLTGLGLLLVGLLVYYFTTKSRDEEIPETLNYGLTIVALLFFTILLYRLIRYFKKR